MPKLTKNQIKTSLLEGKKVKAGNWEISINDRDEVVIFPPTGDGFSTTLAHLDQAVDDYCKRANAVKPGIKRRSEVTLGPDSETQDLLKSPSLKKRNIPSGGVKPDMSPGSENKHLFTPKPRVKSPEVGPAPGGGGMPSEKLGPDSEGDIKWGKGARIRDTFLEDPTPTEFYRELRAKKPSEDLLRDITDERKWVANNEFPLEEKKLHRSSVPAKWEKTVKKMKSDPDIDNPYALANWMEGEGYIPGGKDKKSKRRHKAGPKLREKWDDKGSYHRDIEAESPEELHALTRAFGGEDIDWSGLRSNPVGAEESMDDVVAKKNSASECLIEAVDDTAKDYYNKYFEDGYGKQLTKGDITNKRKKPKKTVQAQSIPPVRQPVAPQVVPSAPVSQPQAPAAPAPGGASPAPASPKPGAPGPGVKPGTGDSGLQALGWTPEDIQLLDDEDKQKILQVQLSKPGTKQPKAPVEEQLPPSGGVGPVTPVPGGGTPTAPVPQRQIPAPVAKKMASDILKKIKFRKAQMLLTGQEVVNTVPTAPAPQVPSPVNEFQTPKEDATEGATIEQKAFQILSEVQQMSVQATTPESVPPMKAQELSRRLLTEIGMPIEEAKSLFGVSRSGQGLISLFK